MPRVRCAEPSPSRNRSKIARSFGLAAQWVFAALLTACTPSPPGEGDLFPEFSLNAPDGTRVDSRSFAGQPVLINFWATWCPPCRGEMAELNTLHHRLAPQGIRLLGISIDQDSNLVREYLLRERLDFPVAIDPEQAWSGPALRYPGLPTTYLIDAQGRIRHAWVGPRRWADPEMEADITARLARK